MEARVEFRILGPLELVENGHRVEVSGGRQRTLLALLLVHANEVVSSDRLIDGLWGEQPPPTAPKVLQNAVSQLRRALGDSLIITRPPGYLLRVEPDAIDAQRFEELLEDGRRLLASGETEGAAAILREALALWRGAPLDEFAYEPFAETEVARLEELRLRAVEERIEADLALGRHADVVGELDRIVAENPLRERPRGQLMVALYRSGRQAEALRVYEDGRRLLAEELGLEPGAALQRLEKQILTHDPVLEPPPLVPLPQEQRTGASANGTVRKRPRRRLAIGLAAVAVTVTALLAAFLLAREDVAPTVVPDALVKVDPETGEIVDVFRVGAGASDAKPAIVGPYVFFSSREREILSRIDVRSGEVDTFGGVTRSPASVAAGADGTVWVGSEEGSKVLRLDAETFELLEVLELPGSGPLSLAVGGGSVWVSEGFSSSISRFSERTGKLQQRYSHGLFLFSAAIAFGAGASWTAVNGYARRGRLLRLDAVRGNSESLEIGRIPYAVAFGFDAVWVSDLIVAPLEFSRLEPGKILRVNPVTGTIDNVVDVGKTPAGLATGGGFVWVANGGERTISKIDPRRNQVVKTIDTRYYPHSLVYGHGFLWVSLSSKPVQWDS